jgi:hypothetical protein
MICLPPLPIFFFFFWVLESRLSRKESHDAALTGLASGAKHGLRCSRRSLADRQPRHLREVYLIESHSGLCIENSDGNDGGFDAEVQSRVGVLLWCGVTLMLAVTATVSTRLYRSGTHLALWPPRFGRKFLGEARAT